MTVTGVSDKHALQSLEVIDMKARVLGLIQALVGLTLLMMAAPLDATAQRGRRATRHPVRVVQPAPKVLARLPVAHVGFTLRGTSFYYHGGAFYRRGPSGYVIVTHPVGAVAVSLPVGAVRVSIGASVFYRHEGVFFVRAGDAYEVVEPPIGGYVSALPMGYEIVAMDGEDLYYHEGIYYRYDPGRDVYLIVEPPPGVG